MDLSRFHVVSMVSNPVRYESRYRLYEQFRDHMRDSEVNFHTVEVAFGDRPFHIHGCNVLHLRSEHMLWLKENALNLLVATLPPNWEYVCWIDADISFPHWRGPKAWPRETIHRLQHYRIVQLFQSAIDLGPDDEVLQTHEGFVYNYVNGHTPRKPYCGNKSHPGFAWAMSRQTWDEIGGLIDFAALGSGDRHMAECWIGEGTKTIDCRLQSPYIKKIAAYEKRCEHFVKRDIGYVPGSILHHFHGRKTDRRYLDRWKILFENRFDPDVDLKRDWQGLFALSDLGDPRSNRLRDQIRQYFFSRREDANDLG